APVGRTFHLETYGHPEEVATRYMQTASEEAKAATRVAANELKGATKAAADEVKAIRLTRARAGQRGFVSIGGLIFALVAVGVTVYAVSQAHDKPQALKELGANLAVGGLVYRLVGGGGVGLVASSVIGMYSDNAELNRQHEEQEAKDRIAKDFIRKRIPSAV